MDLAVADALLAPGQLDELLLELRLTLRDPLLDLRDLDAPILHLALGLRAKPDRELSRVDLGLTADRLGLALGVGDRPPPLLLAPANVRRARGTQPERGRDRPDTESDQRRDHREHLHSSRRGRRCPRGRRGCSHPALPHLVRGSGSAGAWL